MPRPSLDVISSLDAAWYSKINSNFQKLFNAPFPIFQLTASGGGGPLWTPSDMSTDGWWDPKDNATVVKSGSNVSSISDKSGQSTALTATGTIPFTDATGECDLTGSASLSLTESRSLSEINVFMVMESISGDNGRLLSNSTGADATTLDYLIPFIHGGAADSKIHTYHQQVFKLDSTSDLRGDGNYHVFELQLESASKNLTIDATVEDSDTWTQTISMGGLSIGLGFGSYASMKFKELVVVDSSITTDERQRLQGYLAWRHGIESQLPVAHPYKSAAPTTGSSIDQDARLFDACLGVLDEVLYLSDGTNWNQLDFGLLNYIADLDTGTATLNDVKTAYNNLLADMQSKNWML